MEYLFHIELMVLLVNAKIQVKYLKEKNAGQLGNKRVTTKLSIVSIDNDEGLILIKGSIPGSKGGFVYIKMLLSLNYLKG